ncbi:MAG: DUF2207 domain-containing protein [Thermomicrobiales bacterium]
MTRSRWSIQDRRWHAAVLLLPVLALLLAFVPIGDASAASSVTWERYDVDMTVNADGTVHVVERQVVQFDGRFSHGFANIPLANVDDIDNVKVSIADSADGTPEPARQVGSFAYDQDPGTYTASKTASTLEVDYAFDPTEAYLDTDRLIVLEYDVIGGLRVYTDIDPANQQLWWTAIASDVTDIAPIEEATVTITLPDNVGETYVASPATSSVDGKTFTWTKSDMKKGDDFEVRLQFPPITSATVQDWQVRDDQVRKEREEAQQRSDIAGTILFVAGALLAIGGGIGLYGIWYTQGRDPQVGPVADFLAEPPDDLRPGAAGALIDEVVDQRDVIASIVDLGNRGVLKIEEKKPEANPVAATTMHFTLQASPDTVGESERVLLRAIFGDGAETGTSVSMTQVQQTFRLDEKEIHNGYYQELVDHHYFDRSPDATRQRWRGVAFVIPVIAIAVSIAVLVFSGAFSGWVVFPIGVGIVLTIVASKLAQAMPRKTLAGAESAAKWRAFKTYLSDIEKYEKIEESKAIFDKYLPYAIAFGLEYSWVNKFAIVDTPIPGWYEGGFPAGGYPGGYGRRRGGNGPVIIWGGGQPWGSSGNQGGNGGSGNSGGGGGGIPGWQDTSDSAGRSLQSGSDSFLGMLGNVAKALGESSKNSGGWGGGGGWSGGGGGGGGGGFSGGGSSGGGGGGGSRGFG